MSPLVEFVTCRDCTAVRSGAVSEPTPVAALIPSADPVMTPFEVVTMPVELSDTGLLPALIPTVGSATSILPAAVMAMGPAELEMPDIDATVPTTIAPELRKLNP